LKNLSHKIKNNHKELMEDFIGLVALLTGFLNLWRTYKHSVPEEEDYFNSNIKGYLGSICLIIIGILFILGYLEW